MSFNIAEIRRFAGLSDNDAVLLASMKPALQNHSDQLIEAFYANLDQVPQLNQLLDAQPERREKLQAHLKAWLVSLATGTYDETYQEKRYKIGQRHVEVGLDPRWVIGAMSFCRGQIPLIVESEYGSEANKAERVLALDRVMDLDLNIMLQSYDDKRMEMFLETTGFSKALFESMISSADS